jgi:hypothetical protein
MAVILEFRRSEETAARIAKPAEGTLGEIIIFPGVRIERYKTRKPRKTARQTVTPPRRRAQRSRKK